MAQDKQLINFLRGCPEGFDRKYGLCYNIIKFNEGNINKKAFEAMYKVVRNWEYFSGSLEYPIMGEVGSAVGVFNKTGDMYTGEYGRRRIELANLIADELERQLCKSS